MAKIRLSSHNGRSGKNGVYNVSHNDRRAKRADEKDAHIMAEKSEMNKYWTWDGAQNFKESELAFYEKHFGKTVEARNQRYLKKGQKDRIRTIEDMYRNPTTAPQETILQIGSREQTEALTRYFKDEIQARKAMVEIIQMAVRGYLKKYETENIHVLNYAIHADEASIHVHLRSVFEAQNEKGENMPNQNQALKNLGYKPPQPEKPEGRYNNRKQTFDAKTRAWWLEAVQNALFRYKTKYPEQEIVTRYLAQIETEPKNSKTAEKNDYIIQKQKEEIEKNKKMIQYQEAFKEFVKEMEEAELEKERTRTKERTR